MINQPSTTTTTNTINPLSVGDFLIAYDRGESGDAELFAKLFKDQVVFDHARKEWNIWSGHYWKPDLTHRIYTFVSKNLASQYFKAAADAFAAGLSTKSGDPWAPLLSKRAYTLGNLKRVENVLKLAASEINMSLTGSEWDADPLVLAVENGVIELKTGILRDGIPRDYIRSHAPVIWEGIDMPCPAWEKFQLEIAGNDLEIVEFKQKLFGYSITGQTTEHKLPIPIGEGRNGKSTEFEVLGNTLGQELATSSDADVLMDSKKSGEGPKPFVYALWGKRFVWVKESNEGRRIDAGLVKTLTGGDTLTVRDMYSRPVTFKPTHTVFLMTNNKPHIPADDSAIWDRIILIPYEERFIDFPKKANEHQVDKLLKTKLEIEKSGILAWLVRGFLEYQKSNCLNIPQKLLAATNEYRKDEDTLSQFLDEICEINDLCSVMASALYAEYHSWSISNGENILPNRTFGTKMKKRFHCVRTNQGVFYQGIKIK